ncbi:AfsR/SARP family transcriptional regulator [Saccharopolyspora erythraea]|nr:AfsR/SARP family transcriptional regulator [Saccharopolyspora erythraea]
MRYRMLGPLRVVDRGGDVPVNSRHVELVLASLLFRANQVVSVDQLVTEIWGDDPPRRAVDGIYVYVSQLRKFLGRFGQESSPITTRSPGYVLHVGPGALDVHAFQRLMDKGRVCMRMQRYEEASTSFQSALSLWRGPVLGEMRGGPIISRYSTWLEEARLECLEAVVSTGIALGRHQELVGLLRMLIAEHPLHEEFYRQLMITLYQRGRRADALRVYNDARETLNRELGLEPNRGLQELQRSILVGDGELAS